jgi:serine/threonine protein kinase/Tol biopolymer transport system component
LIIGSSISHYRIVEKLGEGGMGVVYKAEDTKLERTVALKFLAQHLLDDDEAKERFLREAKAAAAIDHPNICHVHEIGEEDGKTFIAMAYLEGESLEERITEGPLSIKDALDVARQVADGLDAAHEKGVFHRDIKPANIMVDAKGRATIMDFGLARLTEASRLTKVDTAMGTVAYMSPEQGQGMEVDGRTDIWALGCVLYEMVSGQRPFQGQYDQALLYEICHEEPQALTGLRTGVPVELELLTAKCLEKEREDRYGSAQEVARDLRKLGEKLRSGRSTILRTSQMTGAVPATMTATQTVNPAEALPPDAVVMKRSSQRTLQALAAIATLAFLGLLAFNLTQAPPEAPPATVTRFSFDPEGLAEARISPDGQYILYAATTDAGSSLWLRPLGDESARRLAGTEGAIAGFWSPDSSWIGFGTRTELKRVSIDGGSPITLCEFPDNGPFAFLGGTWSPDDERIVFSSNLRLFEVAARGGQPELLFDSSDGPRPISVRPHFLPAGHGPAALVYVAATSASDGWVAVLNLETGERRELGPGQRAVYSQDGYLIHGNTDSNEPGLWAWPFSLETLEPTAYAFPISTAGLVPTVSHDGTLAYLDQTGGSSTRTLAWLDRTGELLETVGLPQNMAQPALSPDGQRVAVRSNESGNNDIWIHDLIRSTKTRLTFDEVTEAQPAWSPDGREIAYRHADPGPGDTLMRKSADGTGEPTVLVESENDLRWPDWSHDGRYLVYTENSLETGADIRYVELGSDGAASEPVTFLSTPANEDQPQLSPDGRFLAYQSDESGRPEIYVQPFPNGAGKWQVSGNGGDRVRWSSDGSELFYTEGTTLMAVTVSTEQGFTLGQPQVLFESPSFPIGGRSYDVSADGQRFVMATSVGVGDDGEVAPPSIRVVENWYEEFRGREQ